MVRASVLRHCARQEAGPESSKSLTAFGRDFSILESPCCAGSSASIIVVLRCPQAREKRTWQEPGQGPEGRLDTRDP